MSSYIFIFFLNDLLAQTFLEFLMDLNCLSENVSISGMSDYQDFANACAKRNNNVCKTHNYYPNSDCCGI